MIFIFILLRFLDCFTKFVTKLCVVLDVGINVFKDIGEWLILYCTCVKFLIDGKQFIPPFIHRYQFFLPDKIKQLQQCPSCNGIPTSTARISHNFLYQLNQILHISYIILYESPDSSKYRKTMGYELTYRMFFCFYPFDY